MNAVPVPNTSKVINHHLGLSKNGTFLGGSSQKLGGPGLEASLLSRPSCLDETLLTKAT